MNNNSLKQSEKTQCIITAEEKVSQAQQILNWWYKSKTNVTDNVVLDVLNEIMYAETKADLAEAIAHLSES